MIAVLLVNMVQAVEPVANVEKIIHLSFKNLKPLSHCPVRELRPRARRYLDHTIFYKSRYFALSVALVWGGIVAVVATQLPYDS